MGVLEIFGEDGLGHGLHLGQTAGVQEVKGLGARALKEQGLPKAPMAASSGLVEKLHGTDPHSVHNEGEKGPFQAGTENTGVSPHNLVGSL